MKSAFPVQLDQNLSEIIVVHLVQKVHIAPIIKQSVIIVQSVLTMTKQVEVVQLHASYAHLAHIMTHLVIQNVRNVLLEHIILILVLKINHIVFYVQKEHIMN